jgi:cytochrome c oxidase cbb3-type subunit 3
MRSYFICLIVIFVFTLGLCSCSNSPGKPKTSDIPIVPSDVADFQLLYQQNCAGCHGIDGKGGPAIALSDPVYLAIADDDVLHRVITNGIAGTLMPAFGHTAGGMLTDKQIDAIVRGIRDRWSKPDALQGETAPSYSSSDPGDPSRGSNVYITFCSSCHGAEGGGGQKAGSIVDPSFLDLTNDQVLRTIVIVGRPELGAPDWRGNVPGKPMSAQDVSDVVAWLASQRQAFPGQPYSVTKLIGEKR